MTLGNAMNRFPVRGSSVGNATSCICPDPQLLNSALINYWRGVHLHACVHRFRYRTVLFLCRLHFIAAFAFLLIIFLTTLIIFLPSHISFIHIPFAMCHVQNPLDVHLILYLYSSLAQCSLTFERNIFCNY